MKKSSLGRALALAGILLLVLTGPLVCYAETTGQKLNDAKQDKSDAKKQLDKVQDSLDELNSERVSVQTYLDQLNEQLNKLNYKLGEIEQIRESKEQAIEDTQVSLEEAKVAQEKRYAEMKRRIQFMYEKGTISYLEFFLGAKSFSDLINKADYIERINRYDRRMLAEYKQAEIDIAKQEKQLSEEKDSLHILEEEASADAQEIFASVQETGKKVSGFLDEIAVKEKEALEYEQRIAQAESDITVLTEQYKQELEISAQSATMVSRDLSDILFSSGDIDLIAAIIECEAGGEPYTGKVAVGAVVLNRVRSPLFQPTVLEVIMAPRQFSPVGSGRFAMVLARGANESCYQAAADAMAGASPVGNCLFFRTPIPGLTGQQIGGHIFY